MFQDYRSQGAPIAFTPDPATGHDTGDSRYLAIPFFDSTLAMRLPDTIGEPLKIIDQQNAYLASVESTDPTAASQFAGDPLKASWLPDKPFALKWSEFVKTGAVSDSTSPPEVNSLTTKRTDQGMLVRWEAEADFESGIQQFLILRNGKEIGRVPSVLPKKPYRNLYQGKTYGDTPVAGYSKTEFVDSSGKVTDKYEVISINSVGLESK
ncbi:MAG: hypothetical protein MK324_15845 [Pirellulales bacterium]|nr:hypothetical protein [Pirellulales bacterium]